MNISALQLFVSLAVALVAQATTAAAQTFPTRPITVIVPFAPGASTDIVMRLVGSKFSEKVGQTVIVENKPGGGGTTGAVAAKLARPDGYTLLFGNVGTHVINPAMTERFPYDPVKDFQPITGIMSFANLLLVPANSSARTVAELMEAGRSRLEGLTFASQGVGSAGHVMAEMLRASSGVQMVHVPYKGGSPAVLDTIAGRVDFLFGSYLTAGAYVRDGRLRVLGYAAKMRSSALPDVPTMAEAGYDGVDLDFWFALFAPAGTPQNIVLSLNKSFREAANDPGVAKIIRSQAAEVFTTTPGELGRLILNDRDRLLPIMRRTPK